MPPIIRKAMPYALGALALAAVSAGGLVFGQMLHAAKPADPAEEWARYAQAGPSAARLDAPAPESRRRAPAGEPREFERTADGVVKVPMEALSAFEYEIPSREALLTAKMTGKPLPNQVPEHLQALDGEPVAIAGFMVPMDIARDGNVRRFALTVDQQFCCYGVPPALNEWIDVELAGDAYAAYPGMVPVAVYGRLSVGEALIEDAVSSVYRLKAQRVEDYEDGPGALPLGDHPWAAEFDTAAGIP